MAAVYQVRPRVYAGPGQVYLILVGPVLQLLAPMESADYVFRAVVFQLLDGGDALVGIGHIAVVVAVYADNKAAFRGEETGLSLAAVGHPDGVQRGKSIVQALLAKVHGVIIGGGDIVYAAPG